MAISASDRTAPVALSEEESCLADEIVGWLAGRNAEECRLAADNLARLRALGGAVFAYPSIRGPRSLRGDVFDEERLVSSLLESSQLLRIPTKVIVMRGFLVAKCHTFALLCGLSKGEEPFRKQARQVVSSVIAILIAEAIYLSCIGDPGFPEGTKTRLAGDLIGLWESGMDRRALRHFSALSSLWAVRESCPPIFGTMNGTAELMRLTIDMDEDWRGFLLDEAESDETRWALEEFLFGLSWEEVRGVRGKLALRGEDVVGQDGVRELLDSAPAFRGVSDGDPRTLYDFFVERRDSCTHRQIRKDPGPAHTIEEIYLRHRILLEPR